MSEPVSAFDLAAGGMAAQRLQMDVIAANLAHADAKRADGSAYRAQTAVFEPADQPFGTRATFADLLDVASGDGFDRSGLGASAFSEVSFDQDALDDGVVPAGVRFAGLTDATGQPVDSISQMIALVAAGRAYDADVSALAAAKQMDVEAIDIGQG